MQERLIVGDARAALEGLDAGSVRCCVTSPPYYGLRDYGAEGQIGLESTPEAYVEALVAVFREVRRVLRDDGTLWLNLGDSYCAQGGAHGGRTDNQVGVGAKTLHLVGCGDKLARAPAPGLKPKDLVGIPWRVAFALQADGWYLRSDIIWAKPNPMPESVRDRPTKAHEYVFLLSKSERYFYDAEAIREPDAGQDHPRRVLEGQPSLAPPGQAPNRGIRTVEGRNGRGRNCRSVWTIPTRPYSGAHFATFPPELARRCILAGSAEGDTVLDPFFGAGTTGLVAERLGRRWVGVELNPGYARLAEERISAEELDLFSATG